MTLPLRVSQLMLSKGLGGAERYFVDLCRALATGGHTVQAIFHREFVARGELEGHPNVECVPIRILASWDRLAQHTILRHVREFSPHLIQAHLARGAKMGGQAGHTLGLPVVVKTHNLVKLKYYRHVNRFIATTAAQKAYLTAHGIAPNRISIVPNFSALATVPGVLAPHTPLRFCSYGRMVEKKGFDVLLRAFRSFLDAGHSGALQIGGEGPVRDDLVSLAAALDLNAQVQFTGWVSNPARMLDDNDIFVLPSRDEPFGIVLLEAMARGKAIIATRTQGPLEIFDDDAAWLVTTGDVGALSRALIHAATQPDLLQQKARATLMRFRRDYSVDAVIPKILGVYASMLNPESVPAAP